MIIRFSGENEQEFIIKWTLPFIPKTGDLICLIDFIEDKKISEKFRNIITSHCRVKDFLWMKEEVGLFKSAYIINNIFTDIKIDDKDNYCLVIYIEEYI